MAADGAFSRGAATLYARGDILWIIPSVRLPIGRASQEDFSRPNVKMDISDDDRDLGVAIKSAVLSTRVVEGLERPTAPGFDEALAKSLGAPSAATLYRGLKAVPIECLDGIVTFTPTRRRQGGVFEAFSEAWPDKQGIRLQADCKDELWGDASRKAIAACV